MKTPSRESNQQMDALDRHHEEFNRSKYMGSPNNDHNQTLILKNYYKQELDDILTKKNLSKRMEKQREEEEKRQYNQRLRMGVEAERIKQLSYKNYYQMIMNNQDNLKSKYVNPYNQKDLANSRFVEKGVNEAKLRSQRDYENQLKRQESIKRQFQTVLSHQMHEKQENQKKEYQERVKNNQHLRHVLLTPQQIQKLERQKKHIEMNKYKHDLDKLRQDRNVMSQSQINHPNPEVSPYNTIKAERHNLLLNPVPYNIQNPYILRDMQRKHMISPTSSYNTISDRGYSNNTKKNIFG